VVVVNVFVLSVCGVLLSVPPADCANLTEHLPPHPANDSLRQVIMPSGNGAKAKQKRERNNAKKEAATKGSQLGSLAASLTIQCPVCKTQMNSRAVLIQHMEGESCARLFRTNP
jgi:hypothetical protein